MIHEIYSSLGSFKTLRFRPGLNLLLADKGPGDAVQATRNRSGKTSTVEIVHFLLGERATPKSLLRQSALGEYTFGLRVDVGEVTYTVERSGNSSSEVRLVRGAPQAGQPFLSDRRHLGRVVKNAEWALELGEKMFGLSRDGAETPQLRDREPSFRMLFPYFARRELEQGFHNPLSTAKSQNEGVRQVALSYLFGLEWQLAREWQALREKESGLKTLAKMVKEGTIPTLIGRSDDLEPRLRAAEEIFRSRKQKVNEFRVLPEYEEYKREADTLTAEMSALAVQDLADRQLVAEIDASLYQERAPSRNEFLRLYEEVGLVFPENMRRHLSEVEAFHSAVIQNRRTYVLEESEAARRRIEDRKGEIQRRDARRASVMQTLRTHGALETFLRLQSDLAKHEAAVEGLQKELARAKEMEAQGAQVKQERETLKNRLERTYEASSETIARASRTFAAISSRLYGEGHGRLDITATVRGPQWKPWIHGGRSKGIRHMQIFAFDLTVMSLWAARRMGPRFLIHDSHIFDGVDPEQVEAALTIGKEQCQREGWQYIVTLNSDALPSNLRNDAWLSDCEVPVRVTDATPDGGLFGFRFDPDEE